MREFTILQSKNSKNLAPSTMGFLALLVGVVAGFGAVIFRDLIGLVHNILFLGKFSVFYDANVHTALSPWGVGILLVPIIGAIVVVWLIKNFAPEARGHGVPEVMYAIYMKEGKIRPIVAVIKSLASAISIGAGGSVGREGPIVQIGSTFGSTIGSVIKMPSKQRNILIAAGAAAGIAATFNTPIGALAFAVELMLTTVDASSLFVVIIATVVSTYIGREFLSVAPSFYVPVLTIPDFHLIPAKELMYFIPFGILTGLFSVIFIQGLYWFEDLFEKTIKNLYVRHVIGMALVSLTMYILMIKTGHYYVQGVGYATIVDILKGTLSNPWFLLLLLGLKILSTFLTLGSGASGGIFSPLLFIGITLGGIFGAVVKLMFPATTITPIVFAIAGMSGMVGGATGAILTAIIMVLEMTRDNFVVLPLLITVGTAYIVRKMLSHSSIYTLKLLRRGEIIPEGLHAAVALAQQAQFVMHKKFTMLSLDELKEKPEFITDFAQKKENAFTVISSSSGKVLGFLKQHTSCELFDEKSLLTCIDDNFIVVNAKATLPEIVRGLKEKQCDYALVASHKAHLKRSKDIIGVVSKEEILHSSQEAYCLF